MSNAELLPAAPGRRSDTAPGRRGLSLAPLSRPRPPRVPFVVVVALVALGGVVGLLLFNTSMQQASFAASALERQASTLAAREQGLVMELEAARDPQRVARVAREAGMVPASSSCFLSLADGRTSGPCTPASAADGQRIEPRPTVRPTVLTPVPRPAEAPAEQNQVGGTDRNAPAAGDRRVRNGGGNDGR